MPFSSSRRLQSFIPNRYILAIFGLLVVMAVSIALAVIFPYQDLNAQNAAAAAFADNANAGVIVDSSGSGVGVGSGSVEVSSAGVDSGVLADDAPSSSSSVGVGNPVTQSSGGNKGIDTQAAMEAVTTKPNNDQIMENTESPIVSNNVGGESLNELVAELVSAEASLATTPSINDKVITTDNVKEEEESISDEDESIIFSTSNVASNNEDNSMPTSTAQQQDDHVSLFDNEDTPSGSTAGVISSPTMSVIASPTVVPIVPADETASAIISTTENDIHQQQQDCQSLLQQANLDSSNNLLDSSAYVTFVTNLQKKLTHSADDVGEEDEEGTTNHEYIDLPHELKINFLHLSCVCPAANANCCTESNGIYIGDVVEGNDVVIEEDYKNSSSSSSRICAHTLTAIGGLSDQWE